MRYWAPVEQGANIKVQPWVILCLDGWMLPPGGNWSAPVEPEFR